MDNATEQDTRGWVENKYREQTHLTVPALRATANQQGSSAYEAHLITTSSRCRLQSMLNTSVGSRVSAASIRSTVQRRNSAPPTMATPLNLLIYPLRRDLRVQDNPIFHSLATDPSPYTHLLPVYVFPAQQMEVSGFIPKGSAAKSPYPEARSAVGNFWRCGPHRAKFVTESVWDLKEQLEGLESGLEIRVGNTVEVVKTLIEGFEKKDIKVGGVWITNEEGVEEKREERDMRRMCDENDVDFKVFTDEKYLIDDRDIPCTNPNEIPDVFTTYRKSVEPLRSAPRDVLPPVENLPPLPPKESTSPQHEPFVIPSNYDDLEACVLKPISLDTFLSNPPSFPAEAQSAHPFRGGATNAEARIVDLIETGSMTQYKATRNGLLGTNFSTKLSAWLSLGCITARQIHAQMQCFEDGTHEAWKDIEGFGQGENDGTKAVRFELLWRDYMRLCTRKFGPALFRLSGFRNSTSSWKNPASDAAAKKTLQRFLEGTTGMGLIDASQREVFLTGYTSNRARQNAASFLTKHLGIDWRLGAEWYEATLVDYDVSSNWGNWQYVAGVGNDPRGEARVFNPVKQAWDYDPKGEYVATWIPELRNEGLETGELFQAWTVPEAKREQLGLQGLLWVDEPLKKIEFTVGKRGGRQFGRGRGAYRGKSENILGEKGMGRGSGSSRGGYGGRGYGSGGGGGYNGGGYGGGREVQYPAQMGGYAPYSHGHVYGYEHGYGQAYAAAGPGVGYAYNAGRGGRTGMTDRERVATQGDQYASEQG